MQKIILKAGEPERFHIALAYIDKKPDGSYEAGLSLMDKKWPRAKKETSKIRITGRNKEIVIKQIKEIAGLYPPVKDIWCMDVEDVKNEYKT